MANGHRGKLKKKQFLKIQWTQNTVLSVFKTISSCCLHTSMKYCTAKIYFFYVVECSNPQHMQSA